MKRIILLLAVTAILVLAFAVPTFAQPPEVIPPYEQGTETAKSYCSFSGLNDNDPEEEGADLGRVQSYGDYVKENVIEPSVVKSGPGSDLPSGNPGGSPGFYCNPTNVPLK